MEKKLTNNGPLKESADKHSICTIEKRALASEQARIFEPFQCLAGVSHSVLLSVCQRGGEIPLRCQPSPITLAESRPDAEPGGARMERLRALPPQTSPPPHSPCPDASAALWRSAPRWPHD